MFGSSAWLIRFFWHDNEYLGINSTSWFLVPWKTIQLLYQSTYWGTHCPPVFMTGIIC